MGSKGYTFSIIFSLILFTGAVFAFQDAFAAVTSPSLILTPQSGGDIQLVWSASTPTAPDTSVTYSIERSTTGAFAGEQVPIISGLIVLSYTDTGGPLVDGTEYWYRVTATGDGGGTADSGTTTSAFSDASVDVTNVSTYTDNTNAPSGTWGIVGNVATVSVNGGGETLTITGSPTIGGLPATPSIDGSTVTITRLLTGGEPEGTLTYSVTVEDAVGNSQTFTHPPTLGSEVTLDFTLDALTGVSILSTNALDNTLAKSGDTVEINYALPAEVGVAVTSVTIGGQAASTSNPAQLVLDGNGDEGLLAFSIAYTDAAGNTASQTTTTDASSVTSDFTLVVSPIAIASNNANTALAKSGDDVTVSLTSSETLTITGSPTIGTAVATPSADGTTVTAARTLDGTEPEAVLAFSVTVQDAAGNSDTYIATTDASSVTADFTVDINLVGIVSDNLNLPVGTWAILGNEVTVIITSDETLTITSQTIDGKAATASPDGTAVTAKRTMDATETPGALAFSVTVEDPAGNSLALANADITDGSSVTADFIAPGPMTGVAISSNNANDSTLAKSGDTVSVAYTVPEAGVIITSSTIGSQAASVLNPSTLALDGNGDEGLLAFSIAYTDAAGNPAVTPESTVDNGSTVTSDFTPPGPMTGVGISSNNAKDTSLAKSGDTVSVAYTVPEAGIIVTSSTIGSQAASTANPSTLALDGNGDEGLLAFSIAYTDAAGNPAVTPESTVDNGSTVTSDFTNPSVNGFSFTSVAHALIADDDDGTELVLTYDFDELMDTGILPTSASITFDADIIGSGTLTLDTGVSKTKWVDSDTFQATYDITDIDDTSLKETEVDVDVTITGGEDPAGNVQNSNTQNDIIDVDTENPIILSITPSDTLIQDSDDTLAVDVFTITVVYDEKMNSAVANEPSVALVTDPQTSGTLVSTGGSWNSPTDDTWTESYTIVDTDDTSVGVTIDDVDITVTGAVDLALNPQVADGVSNFADNAFDVDTENPIILSITPSDTLIQDSDDTLAVDVFTITVVYDEKMNSAVANEPSVALVTDPQTSGTLVSTGGSWNSPTDDTWTESYTIVDTDDTSAGVTILDVDITVTGAVDLALNPQVADGVSNFADNAFDVDTENPIILSITDNSDTLFNLLDTLADADVLTNDIFTVEVIYDETMDNTADPNISFTPDIISTGTLTSTGGIWSTTTLTDDTYTESYSLTDVGETVVGVDITVEDAVDDFAGNEQVETIPSYFAENRFNVDTENPRIPTSTLIIESNNTYDPATTVATQVATTGNTIKISLDANEALDIPVDGDISIQSTPGSESNVNFIDTTPNDNAIQATLVVDGAETQGVTLFSWTFRDLVKNLGDPDSDACSPLDDCVAGGSISITPEPATNAHITDGSQVVLDYTAPPTRTVVIETSDGDPAMDPQYTYERNAQDITLTCDDDFDTVIAVAECFETEITGDIEGTPAPEPFVTTETRDFISERGNKAITVEFCDRAGNCVTENDNINLDAIIRTFTITSSTSGEWEDAVFTFEGSVENPKVTAGAEDQMLVDAAFRLDPSAPTPFDFPGGYTFGAAGVPNPGQCVSLTQDLTSDPSGDTYTFTASTEYPRPSQNLLDSTDGTTAGDHTQTPDATLVEFGCAPTTDFDPDNFTPVTETSVTTGPAGNTDVDLASALDSEVLERPTSVNLNPIGDTFIGNAIGITGGVSTGASPDTSGQSGLVDDIDGTGIPDKLIDLSFFNSPTSVISDAITHNGLIFEDNDGIEVTNNGIMRLKPSTTGTGAGGTIHFPDNTGFIPANPTFVFLTLKANSIDNFIQFEITDADDPPTVSLPSLIQTGPQTIQVLFEDIDGISKIEVKDVFDDGEPPLPKSGETLGLSKIETRGSELELINSFDFKNADVISSSPFNTKTFDTGFFFANGTVQNTAQNNLIIHANFTDTTDPDYLKSFNPSASPPNNQKEFSVYSSSLAGYTSTGDATVNRDSGKGIDVVLCEYDPGDTNGNGIIDDDVDRDAVCDSWETNGIPFRQFAIDYFLPIDFPCPSCTGDTSPGADMTAAGNPVNLLDEEAILTGTQNSNDLTPSLTKRDYYLEIDAMKLHPADIRALNDVITLWADLSGPPALPRDAIAGVDYSNVEPGVALHIFLDEGRLLAEYIDSDASMDFTSGEPLYEDVDDSGTVTIGDARLLNTINDRTIVASGNADLGTTLESITAVPDDGLKHRINFALWNNRNVAFDDDFNMVKNEHYGIRSDSTHATSQISSHLSKNANNHAVPLFNTIQVCDASEGEYDIIIDGLSMSTPAFDIPNVPDSGITYQVDRTRGVVVMQILVKTDNGGDPVTPIFTKGNSCHTEDDVFRNESQNPDIVLSAERTTNFYTSKGSNAVTGATYVTFEFAFSSTEKVTDAALPSLTVPFTISNVDQAPFGCTSSSGDDTFCVSQGNANTAPEFPRVDSRMRDAYAQVYRYMEYIHNFGGPSGEAELLGNDIAIALGNGFGLAFNNHDGGTRHEQASTVAHELLHTVNFLHGGPQWLNNDLSETLQGDTAKNCKPFPGVDKYTRQIPGVYLDLVTADPITGLPTGGPHDDVHSTSEWKLEYSDGSHGSSPLDFALDTAHILSIGGIGGLDESALIENAAIPGTPYTMVWATPDTGNTHKQLSNIVGIDWDDSGGPPSGTVSADINNFGISGCVASSDPTYYDYDTGYHMDFNFRQGASGQIDGVTPFFNEATDNELWESIALEADFDGYNIGNNLITGDSVVDAAREAELQSGETVVLAGTTHQIAIQIQRLDEFGNPSSEPFRLKDNAKAQVWVSQNPSATIEGDDPTLHWLPVVDANPFTVDDMGNPLTQAEIDENAQLMRWVDFDENGNKIESLLMDWATPSFGFEVNLPDNDAVTGPWFIRTVFYDPADAENLLFENVGLFGKEDDPDSNFLKDTFAPILPNGDDLKATGMITLQQPEVNKDITIIPALEELRGSPGPQPNDKETKKDLNKAIERITASINPVMWVDDLVLQSTATTEDNLFGKNVFQEERLAAVSLMDILGLPTTGKSTSPVNDETPEFLFKVREVLLRIVTVDRILADVQIQIATSASGSTAECVVLANDQMISATDATLIEEFDVAINHYQEAWNLANKELLGQNCGGTPPAPDDTDGDGISDADEISGALNPFGPNDPTDPLNPDSDGDGLNDGFEIANNTDPNNPADPTPPPPPTQQVEMDALIALIAQLTKDKEINKGVSNLLTGEAQAAKVDFINGDNTAGCEKINNIEVEIVQTSPSKMSQTAEDALLADAPAVGSTKTVLAAKLCEDTSDLFGPGVSGNNKIGSGGNGNGN